MATERFRNLSPERRSVLLNAAMAEFASAGFVKAKLENIAKGAGVTKGLLYYYFEDREDLLVSLYANVVGILTPAIGSLPDKPTPDGFWSWIERVYRDVLELVARQPVLLAFMVRVLSEVTNRNLPPAFEKHQKRTVSGVLEVVTLGQKCGAVRKDLPEPLLLGAVMGLMEASDRWLVSQAQTGKLSSDTPATVLRLYRSAFAPPVMRATRRRS